MAIASGNDSGSVALFVHGGYPHGKHTTPAQEHRSGHARVHARRAQERLYDPGFEPCFKQISPVLINPIAFVPAAITWVFLVAKAWTMRAVGLVLIILPFFVAWLAIIVFGPQALFIGLKFSFVPFVLAVLWLTVRMITKKPPLRSPDNP
jgi:hypothetical protein